jgi:imidazolonepropionase-like amidohydrolase
MRKPPGSGTGSLAAKRVRHPALVAMALALLPLSAATAASTALVAARIIDGRSDALSTSTVLLVEGDRITAMGDRSIIPAGAEVIDLGDATLMPGMINAHEHPLMFGHDYQQTHLTSSSAYKALMGLAGLQRLLLAGWTGVRVMGDADVYYANQDLRKAIDSGIFIGPRMAGAAHYISITGGGGDVNYFSPEQPVRADGLVVDGPEEIRKAIRQEIKYGSDWIKLLVTGAFESVGDDPRNVAFSPEELRAAVEEANRHGVPVAAHAHATEGIKQAVAAGVRSIEHGTYMDDEAMKMMAKRGTFLVPTVYLGDYYEESEDKLRAQDKNDEYIKHGRKDFLAAIARAHRTGVKVVVGLDLGGYIADPKVYAREFAVFVEAGMSPMAAIQAGTRVAAELMKWDDRLGTLERGKLADIIAVPGNPLADIKALEQVSMVMLGGKVLKRPGQHVDVSPQNNRAPRA